MPRRVDPANKRGEQLLLRLTTEELDWLESAAHLERATVNAYVYSLVRSHVASLATNAHVRADRQNRRSYDDASTRARNIGRPAVAVSFTDVEIANNAPSAAT